MSWKLVRQSDGSEIKIGDEVSDFRGRVCILKGMEPPKHSASTGRVTLQDRGAPHMSYVYPSVIESLFVEEDPEIVDAANNHGQHP
jgi:hypothetical protein